MSLVIKIELTKDVRREGLEEIERLLLDAVSRLPVNLGKTSGSYMLHDSAGNYCGQFRIE